jgi:hypothetical protein
MTDDQPMIVIDRAIVELAAGCRSVAEAAIAYARACGATPEAPQREDIHAAESG